MSDFKYDKSREAVDSIRGYVYQIYQSLLAWISLKDNEILFLERGEDFDIEAGHHILATQVKDTIKSGTVTLKKTSCIEALNHFWGFKIDNPTKKVSFRFLTTSDPGKEQGASFPDFQKGLIYWEQAAQDETIQLSPLREYLKTLSLSEPLAKFLESSTDERFRSELLQPFKWDTGSRQGDALRKLIKNQLVIHGDDHRLSPFYSEKAFGFLLDKLIVTISSDSPRDLSRVDFLRAFEDATMELVSKQEADLLKSGAPLSFLPNQASDYANVLPTPYSRPVLTQAVPLVSGASRRSSLVGRLCEIVKKQKVLFLNGSTGSGKTSIASLVSSKMGGEWLWANLRDSPPEQTASSLGRAYYEIEKVQLSLNIIIDDLDLKGVKAFEKELIALVFYLRQKNRTVLVTGYQPPSNSLLRSLWLKPESSQSIPYFSVEEVEEMIPEYGLSDPKRVELWGKVIHSTTSGHPQLVHARVSNLSGKQWPAFDYDFLLNYEDINEEREDIRTRLVNEISQQPARELVYRLSMMTCHFPRQVALDLGKMDPAVLQPGEHFDSLIGPWVERIGEDDYRISPLISDAGKSIYGTQDVEQLHEQIVIALLGPKEVDVSKLNALLLHSMLSKSEVAFTVLIPLVYQLHGPLLEEMAEYVDWFASVGLEEGQLLCPSNQSVEAFIRYLQLQIAIGSSRSETAVRVFGKLIVTINALDNHEGKEMMYVMAYRAVLNNTATHFPPKLSIIAFENFVDLTNDNEFLRNKFSELTDRIVREGHSDISPIQALAGMIPMRARGLQDFDELLDALNSMAPEKRDLLFSLEPHEELDFSDALTNASWLEDVKNETLDTEKTIYSLEKAITFANKWDKPQLVRAASITISVLHDEYRDDPIAAVQVLDELDSSAQRNGKVQYQRGKILFGQEDYPSALKVIVDAVDSGDLVRSEKVLALRHKAIAAARCGDWGLAKDVFLDAATAADQVPTFITLAGGLRAEAAHASWRLGDKKGTLLEVRDILGVLETIPYDRDIKTRHLHAVVRHFIGWLNHEVSGWENQMVDPFPGMFSTLEPHKEMEAFEIIDIDVAWALLGRLDERIGAGLGIAEQISKAERSNVPLIFKMTDIADGFKKRWTKEQIVEAVPYLFQLNQAYLSMQKMQKEELGPFYCGELSNISSEYWKDDQNVEQFLLCLVAVGIKGLSLPTKGKLPVKRWLEDLDAHGVLNSRVEKFLKILEGKIDEPQSQLPEVAASALYYHFTQELTPADYVICHFRMLNAADKMPNSQFCERELAEVMSEQWLTITNEQAFSLKAPQFYCPAIQDACMATDRFGCEKAAVILDTAIDATGVTIFTSSARQYVRSLFSG